MPNFLDTRNFRPVENVLEAGADVHGVDGEWIVIADGFNRVHMI